MMTLMRVDEGRETQEEAKEKCHFYVYVYVADAVLVLCGKFETGQQGLV